VLARLSRGECVGGYDYLTKVRVVVQITQSWVKAFVPCVSIRLRAAQVPFSSVDTHTPDFESVRTDVLQEIARVCKTRLYAVEEVNILLPLWKDRRLH
jgi:hypothetical protein